MTKGLHHNAKRSSFNMNFNLKVSVCTLMPFTMDCCFAEAQNTELYNSDRWTLTTRDRDLNAIKFHTTQTLATLRTTNFIRVLANFCVARFSFSSFLIPSLLWPSFPFYCGV